MRYLLLLSGDPELWDAPETPPGDDVITDWVEMTAALRDAGVLVSGDGLEGPDATTTIRRRGEQQLIVDGPFAETHELLIGYYVIDVPDLDAAMAWARRMPNVRWGAVEVRPIRPGPAGA